MTTATLTLTDFLLARLEEDYEIAWGAEPSPWREGAWDGTFDGARQVLGRSGELTADVYYGGTYGHVMRFDPTRVIRDIEAKRRIVEWATDEFHQIRGPVTRRPSTFEGNAILHVLAAIYSDHPDYRSEWAV